MASELVAGDARSKEDPPVDPADAVVGERSEEHTSELQSQR